MKSDFTVYAAQSFAALASKPVTDSLFPSSPSTSSTLVEGTARITIPNQDGFAPCGLCGALSGGIFLIGHIPLTSEMAGVGVQPIYFNLGMRHTVCLLNILGVQPGSHFSPSEWIYNSSIQTQTNLRKREQLGLWMAILENNLPKGEPRLEQHKDLLASSDNATQARSVCIAYIITLTLNNLCWMMNLFA